MRIRRVNWFRRILALVLLAFWLPATSHCAIETVLGWDADEHCLASCSHEGADAADHPVTDACATVEDGAFKPALATLAAPVPSLTILACLSRVHAALLAEAQPVAAAPWSLDDPADWVPVRHLASRAIAPARAPNLN